MIDEIPFPSPTQLGAVPFTSTEARRLAASIRHSEPASFIGELLSAGMDEDALWMLPYTMSPRHAIWWNCICNWHACGTVPTAGEDRVFGVVVDWLRCPSPDNAARSIAEAARDGLETSLGCCCHAIGLISSPANNKTVLTGVAKLLGQTARMALQHAERRGVPCSARQFVEFGLDVAAGRSPWIDATEAFRLGVR